ncbi:MAG: phage tail protein [Chloroflexota bacterium]
MKPTDIARLLPEVFQRTVGRGTPLDALLEAMSELQERDEQVLTGLDRYFDPRRAPDAFVPFLAVWMDLERVLARPADHYYPAQATDSPLQSGLGRLRELVAASAELSMRRGTARGILRFLEIATGVHGFAVDEEIAGRPYHVRFRAPAGAAAVSALVARLIELEKPAYVTYDLEFGPAASA